jgi:hypothetical protein
MSKQFKGKEPPNLDKPVDDWTEFYENINENFSVLDHMESEFGSDFKTVKDSFK